MKNKENIYLYQNIVKKQGSFTVWKTSQFWENWFQIEILKNSTTFNNKDEFYLDILLNISTIMYNLNIELKFTLTCLVEKIAQKVIKNVFFIN